MKSVNLSTQLKLKHHLQNTILMMSFVEIVYGKIDFLMNYQNLIDEILKLDEEIFY